MLQLITGIPGYGKTAHAIDIAFFADDTFTALDKYVEGISKLDADKAPHYLFPKLSELKSPDFVPLSSVDSDDEEAEKYKPWLPSHPDYCQHKINLIEAKHPIELWYLWAQKGSVLIVDEAQRFYRPRPSGSKVPLHIAMLEYHRHFGIHFLFVSQAPRLLDVHLRSLVEKHVHLDKTWNGGMKYEWSGVRSIDEGKVSPSDKKDSAKSKYSPPKHVFPLYSSSSLHLKVKHKMPKVVWLFLAGVPLALAFFIFAGMQIKKNHIDEKKPSASPASSPSVLVSPASAVTQLNGVPVNASGVPVAIANELKKFEPLVPSHPETAPAYDELRKVKYMPLVSACMVSKTFARCYTQQGTPITEMDGEPARIYVSGGRRFNPYQQAEQLASVQPHALDKKPVEPPASAFQGRSLTDASALLPERSGAPLWGQTNDYTPQPVEQPPTVPHIITKTITNPL